MTSAERKELRAAEYRRLAVAAGELARTSVLEHVREKHEQAAAQWTALALLDERPVLARPTQARGQDPGPHAATTAQDAAQTPAAPLR